MGIGGFLLITLPVQAQKKTKEKQPNVIFIIADDLGYGDMSCYGAYRIQTPHVDEWYSFHRCARGGFNKYPITLFFIYRYCCPLKLKRA